MAWRPRYQGGVEGGGTTSSASTAKWCLATIRVALYFASPLATEGGNYSGHSQGACLPLQHARLVGRMNVATRFLRKRGRTSPLI